MDVRLGSEKMNSMSAKKTLIVTEYVSVRYIRHEKALRKGYNRKLPLVVGFMGGSDK